MGAAEAAVALAQLRIQARTVASVHGRTHPAMIELAGIVEAIAARSGGVAQTDERQRLAALSGGFQPWPGACRTVESLFAGLARL